MENRGLRNDFFQRNFLAVFLMTVNAFSWYFPLHVFFTNTLVSLPIEHAMFLGIYGMYYLSVIIFAVVGTFVVQRRISRETLLSTWMLVGVIASFLLTPISSLQTQGPYLFLVAFTLGASLGLGFPSCLAYFSDYGSVGQKGRLGGITYCTASIGVVLVGLVTMILPSFQSMLAFAFWRMIGLIVFTAIRPKKDLTKEKANVSYREIIKERSFVLYLAPWIMFCLVNFLEAAVLRPLFGPDFYSLIPVMEFGIGSVAALAAGAFADKVGRKRVIIFGYVMLGLGYAVLGLFPDSVFSWYFYIAVDGVAWGILAVMFFIIIWGELAGNKPKDKYYFLGILPFLSSTCIEILFEPYAHLISVFASFSLASLFLFLAILPLMYAPETLPEKNIRMREVRDYVERAKKSKEKYT